MSSGVGADAAYKGEDVGAGAAHREEVAVGLLCDGVFAGRVGGW